MNTPTICAIAALALLGGCATEPSFAPIRSGESVAISVVMSPQARGVIDIRNDALGSDTSTGATSGAVAGGLYGLTCGPFAIVCVPLGAGIGALTGTAAGAAVGVTGALSSEKATQLRERVTRVQQSHAQLAELHKNIIDRAQRYWNLNVDGSATVMTVELQDLQLASTRDERIRCVVHVLVAIRPGDGREPTGLKQKLYAYVGPFSSLAVWMDEGNDFVDTNLTSASQQIAAQIISDLAVR